MSTLEDLRVHLDAVRTMAVGSPTTTRLLDVVLLNTVGELIEYLAQLEYALRALDAGWQLHREALEVLARRYAEHAKMPDHEGSPDG